MKVLHILPDTAGDPNQYFLGSTKDLRGRTEYFRNRGFDVVELIAPRRKDSALLPILKRMDLGDFDVVFIELPVYLASVRWLKRTHPRLKVLVRPINAEFWHHLHYIRSGLKHGYWKRTARYSLFALRRLYQDWACGRAADRVLSITGWETERYWNGLLGPGKTLTAPYFVPESYREEVGESQKEDLCVCLQSTIMNSFLADSARNFHAVLTALGSNLPEWKFLITGENPPAPRMPLPRLQATGFLDSPFRLLARARVMALLSDYGLGFKTKILDAILLRCYVLVTPGLRARLPAELYPFCMTVDPADPDTFRIALEACRMPFPESDPNGLLRDRAFLVLDESLGIRPI